MTQLQNVNACEERVGSGLSAFYFEEEKGVNREGHEIVEWLQFRSSTLFFLQYLKSSTLHHNMNFFLSEIPIDSIF